MKALPFRFYCNTKQNICPAFSKDQKNALVDAVIQKLLNAIIFQLSINREE
jgi:hypothetical protein